MKISEIINVDAEKAAADNLRQGAKRVQQQASAAQARVKIKQAQGQLIKATQPIKTK